MRSRSWQLVSLLKCKCSPVPSAFRQQHGAAPGPAFEESNSLGIMENSEAAGKSANLEQNGGNCGVGMKHAVCGNTCAPSLAPGYP